MQSRVVALDAEPSVLGPGILLLIVVLAVWFVTASAAVLKGGHLDQPNRVAQLYGYSVCLVSVILAIFSFISIVDAAFDRANPLQNEFGFGASLVSFEAYRATLPRERVMMGPGDAARADTSSEATLRARYDALVQERRAATQFRTSKKFVIGGTLLVLSGVLFLVHRRWAVRMSRAVPPAG